MKGLRQKARSYVLKGMTIGGSEVILILHEMQ
jgi:hypothetical protein